MTHGTTDSAFVASNRNRLLAVWALLLAATFAFGWYKDHENRKFSRTATRWQAAQTRFQSDGMAEIQRLRRELSRLQAEPDSQQELALEINHGQPFTTVASTKNPKRDVAIWFDQAHGIEAKFEFEEGRLMGSRMSGPNAAFFEQLNPRPPATLDTTVESMRTWIVRLGSFLWIIAFVAWVVFSRRRQLFAQILLAAALATGMALLVDPRYSITSQGVFSNDSLFVSVVMIPISVAVLAATLEQTSFESSAALFRFRVRDALVLMTIVAFVLAAGPFGYVTLMVAAAGGFLFALVYSGNRAHRRAMLRRMARRSLDDVQ